MEETPQSHSNSGGNIVKAPRIKVCGMTSLYQLHQLGDLGVQFAGMIFYHKSPRFVLRHLKGIEVKRARLKVFKIGVFVNAPYDEVLNHIDNFGLDMVQLHGDETPYYCSKLSNYISVVKAFRVTDTDNIDWKTKDYFDDTDMYLFDTEGAGYGGTGKKFKWDKITNSNISKPFLLSGGIGPDDAGNIKDFLKEPISKGLFAVDINSRFEKEPGVKDMGLVENFIEDLNRF